MCSNEGTKALLTEYTKKFALRKKKDRERNKEL
jgi:hypothetical protein